MERFRLNTPYPMRLNTLSTPFVQQSRLDPNTQMRVITDPLLNMSYRRQFEDYQQNIFTEYLGRVEGTAIGATGGAGIGTVVGTIIGSIASIFVPGDFGTLAVAGAKIGAEVGAITGGTAGFVHADYTTHHATMDIINNTIIESFKQNPAMGVLNSLAFTGKSMDLLMGGEAIRATISAAITGNDMFENIARAYGTHEDGRTEYDFSVIREQMGLDLGAFGNFVFDMTGEIITDPGAWGGLTGKALTFAKGNKAAMEAMSVAKASKELSEVVVKKPKLAKEIARVIRLDDIDGLRRIVAHNTNTLGEDISDEVLQKFMKEVNTSASKSTAYRLNKMFQEWDKTDDFLTAAIFKSTTPFGGWTVLKKGKDLFNQKILSNFIEDSKIAKILYDAGDIIFGNKYRHNFVKQGGEDFLKYINEKYSVYKSGKQYKSMLNDFINGIKEDDELYPLVKQMKDADEDLYTLLSDAKFEKVKTKFVEQINTLTGVEQIAVDGIVSRIEEIDEQMYSLTKDKNFLFLTGDKKSEYTNLFIERQRLTSQFSKHEKNLVGLEYQQRKLNMSEKDRQFKKIINDIKKFSHLERELLESENKALADSITALKELLKSSEGEKFLDDLEKMSYYKNDNFIKFLRDNTDDAIKKEFDEAFQTSKKNYEDTITKYSPKYRKKVLRAEETRIKRRIKELSNRKKLSEEEYQELADLRGLEKEIVDIKSNADLKEDEIFKKAISKINEHKFKHTEASFIEPAKTKKAIEMEQEVSELGDLYKKNLRIRNLFFDTSIKYEPKTFGVQKMYGENNAAFRAKGQEAIRLLMSGLANSFDELSKIDGMTDTVREAMNTLTASISQFLNVPKWLARANQSLDFMYRVSSIFTDGVSLTKLSKNEKYLLLVDRTNHALEAVSDSIKELEKQSTKSFQLNYLYKVEDKLYEISDILLSGKEPNKQLKEIQQIIDKLKKEQFKWLVESYDNTLKHTKVKIEDISKNIEEESSKKREQLYNWLLKHEVSNASIEKIKSNLNPTIFVDEIYKHLPSDYHKEKFLENWLFDYSRTAHIESNLKKAFDKISGSEITIKQLYNGIEKGFEVSSEDFLEMMFDELTTSIMHGSLSSIVYVLEKDAIMDDDLDGFITTRLSTFNSRFLTLKNLFGKSSPEYQILIRELNTIRKLINDNVSKNTLSTITDELNSRYKNLVKLKSQIDRIKAFQKMGITLNYSFDMDSRFYKLVDKKGATSDYNKLLKELFELSEKDMIDYDSLRKHLGTMEDINRILNDPELKVDKTEIDTLKDLASKDINIVGLNARERAWEWIDYTQGLGGKEVVKHRRWGNRGTGVGNKNKRYGQGEEAFKNKKLHEFIYVFVDTETYSKTNGVWSISYTVVKYNPDGTFEIIDKKTMYIEDSILDADFANKTLKKDDLADRLNAKILEQDFKIRSDNYEGATIRLRKEHIERARKEAIRDGVNFKTYSYNEAFEILNHYLNNDDALFVAQNANFDIKQLLNARAKALGKKGLYQDQLGMNMLNLNDSFAQTKLDWNVVDLLSLNKKFNIFDKSQGMTNTAMGMQTLNIERKYYSSTNELLETKYTSSKSGAKNTITVEYRLDGIRYLYNGESLHNADIDVAVMKEWSDIAIKTLMDKKFTLGSIMEGDFSTLADDVMESHQVENIKYNRVRGKRFNYTKRTYFYDDDGFVTIKDPKDKKKAISLESYGKPSAPIYEEILNEKGDIVQENILDSEQYAKLDPTKKLASRDVYFSEFVEEGETSTESLSFNEFFKRSIETLFNKSILKDGFYDPNLSHLFTGDDGLLNLLENTSNAVLNGQGDFKSVSNFVEQLKEIVERYNYERKIKIDRMDYHYNYAEAREAIRPEDEEIINKLNEIINAFTKLDQEVESAILLNHRMLAGDNIMFKQVNRTVVSQDLAYISVNNSAFNMLEKILLGGEIKKDEEFGGAYTMLQMLFNPDNFSQLPDKIKDVFRKYSSHPKIQEIKNTIQEVRESFDWYIEIIGKFEALGDNKGFYLDTMHNCISDIEYKFKHQPPAKTPEQAKEQQDELSRYIRNRFRKAKIQNFNNQHMVFGARAREIFNEIELKYLAAVESGEAPYLTPDSKFTNDFFNKFQEDIIYVFRDAFDNIHATDPDLRKGFTADDPIQVLENLLRDSMGEYRNRLREVKVQNNIYRKNPIGFHEVNGQLREELTHEGKKIYRELRPNMLPGMSSVVLTYAEETRASMKLKARVNNIFAELFKPMDEERLYDPTTLPLVNAEGHTLTRMLEQVSNSLGVDIEMVLEHLEFSDITMDDKLTVLQASLLNKIYEGNFTEVFNEKFINQLGEERLELMRQTAYKILHISEEDFPAIDKTKLEQLKFVFAEALLGVKAMDFERNAGKITDELREQFSIYKKMHEEIDTTSDVWKQVKKFFKNQDGSYDLEGLRNYFRNNKSERLVYIDPVDNKLRLLNTDNPTTLKQAIGSNAEIGIMSIDAFTKYTSKNQLRELPWKWMRVLRSTVLRATKYFSLAFSVPFVVQNAAAATLQDLASMEGGFDVIRFGKAFGETWKMHKMWSKIDHTFGTTLINSVYRRMSKSNDWADFISQSNYLETLKPIEEGLQKYIDKSPEEIVEMLKTEDNKFLRQLLRRKRPDDIVEEMNIIKETIEEFNKLDDTTKTKLLEFNTYMNTASVSGFSAEFSNRELIKQKQAETLDVFKETGDGRYYIYKDTPNNLNDIKTKLFKENSSIEVPEIKSLEDEYNFLEKNKSDLNYYGKRRLKQLDDEIENGYSEWMTNILNKIPKGGLLDFNGSMEEIFRVTMIKTLIDEGMSLDEATAEVIARQFVYMDKSVGEQMAEFIFPFLSYSIRSFDLFNDLAGDASFMEMMYLWDKYSWGSAEEQREKSNYLTSRKVKGAVPIGDTLLNIGNAFTETANLMADPIKGWQNKLNPVIRTATGISPVTQLPGISLASNLVQGLQDMSTGNYTPGQITGLANSFYRNSQYFYSKQPFTTKVKPFYNNLYTSSGFSRIAMNMQPTTLKNVQYRVGNILYKRSIM